MFHTIVWESFDTESSWCYSMYRPKECECKVLKFIGFDTWLVLCWKWFKCITLEQYFTYIALMDQAFSKEHNPCTSGIESILFIAALPKTIHCLACLNFQLPRKKAQCQLSYSAAAAVVSLKSCIAAHWTRVSDTRSCTHLLPERGPVREQCCGACPSAALCQVKAVLCLVKGQLSVLPLCSISTLKSFEAVQVSWRQAHGREGNSRESLFQWEW